MRASRLAKESLLPSLRASWSTFDDSMCTSSDKPRQRVVGRHVGDDGAKRRDRAFELLDRGGIVIGAQNEVELAAEIADRVVVAGELFRRASASAGPREFRTSARSMPASAWPSVPLWRVSSMRRDSERISFSIDSIARRGIASVMAARMSASSERNAAIDCSIPSGRCSASIWLVILSRCRSSEEKSGPAGAAGCIGGAIGIARATWRPLWAARCAAASTGMREHRVRSGARRFPRSQNRTTPG